MNRRIRCALDFCVSSYMEPSVDVDNISFFNFPKDPLRCSLWVKACNPKFLPTADFNLLTKTYRLCSKHFESQMFSNFQRNRLFPNAIPTLFEIGGPRCALSYCKKPCKKSLVDVDDISFFSFPKDPVRCSSWVEVCNPKFLPTTDPTILRKTYKLCSKHFERQMFSNFQRNRLFPNAMPTLFENIPIVRCNQKSMVNTKVYTVVDTENLAETGNIIEQVVDCSTSALTDIDSASTNTQTTNYLSVKTPQNISIKLQLAEANQSKKELEKSILWFSEMLAKTNEKCLELCEEHLPPSVFMLVKNNRFPKDPEKREIWLNACQLTESNVKSNKKISSSHFDPSCFKQSSSNMKLLTWNAVPTQKLAKRKRDLSDFKKMKNISKILKTNDDNNLLLTSNVQEIGAHKSSPPNNVINVMTLDSILDNPSPSLTGTTHLVSPDLTNQLEKEEIITLESILHNSSSSIIGSTHLFSSDVTSQQEKGSNISLNSMLDNQSSSHAKATNLFSSEVTSHENKEIPVKPVRRKSIRYPMDVKIDDLNSPAIAKAYYRQTQLQIMTHRRKIKTLHQNINRLKKKVTSLKSLLRLLKENNVISDTAYDTILRNEEISEDDQKMLKVLKRKTSIKK